MSSPDVIPTRRRRVPGGMPQPGPAPDPQSVPASSLAAVPDVPSTGGRAPGGEAATAAVAAGAAASTPSRMPPAAAVDEEAAATLEAAEHVEAAAAPAAAEVQAATASPERPARSRPGGRRKRADVERTAPARDERRDSRTFRIYRPLYDQLGFLVRDLEDDGFRTDRTELLHALMYLHLPDTPEAAQEMLRRFRMDQPD